MRFLAASLLLAACAWCSPGLESELMQAIAAEEARLEKQEAVSADAGNRPKAEKKASAAAPKSRQGEISGQKKAASPKKAPVPPASRKAPPKIGGNNPPEKPARRKKPIGVKEPEIGGMAQERFYDHNRIIELSPDV